MLEKVTLRKITNWSVKGEKDVAYQNMDEGVAAEIQDANVAMSLVEDNPDPVFGGRYHALLLDLDVPAYLIPSTTPGHSHLYVDAHIPEERYFALLDTLADCGVIEHGYAGASQAKGGSYLRLPWIKKEAA